MSAARRHSLLKYEKIVVFWRFILLCPTPEWSCTVRALSYFRTQWHWLRWRSPSPPFRLPKSEALYEHSVNSIKKDLTICFRVWKMKLAIIVFRWKMNKLQQEINSFHNKLVPILEKILELQTQTVYVLWHIGFIFTEIKSLRWKFVKLPMG